MIIEIISEKNYLNNNLIEISNLVQGKENMVYIDYNRENYLVEVI